MISLRPTADLPLYAQLKQYLMEQIASGGWPRGSAIPSERELMQQAGVSRATVRRALDDLVNEGVLERVHGSGTFVTGPHVEQEMRTVYSFTSLVRAQGLTPSTRVLLQAVEPATPEVAAALKLLPNDAIIHLVRLRLADDVPMMLDDVHLPYRLCPNLVHADLSGSLYELLEQCYGLAPRKATDQIDAVVADEALARALQISQGAPVIRMRRLAVTHDDIPIEYTFEHARADRVRYRINLVTEPSAAEVIRD